MPLMPSWIEAANDPACPFPLNNLPCGVFSIAGGPRRCGVAIGDRILDVTAMEAAGLIALSPSAVLDRGEWNPVMALGPSAWTRLRHLLLGFLRHGSDLQSSIEYYLHPMEAAELHLPFAVTEYTDFYASRQHATNVGTMFRGKDNALPPNWLHIPIGYNGRASSVVVSGTDIHRPWGQLKGPDDDAPRLAPSERFDFELEMGAVVGTPSRFGRPVSVAEADAMIFGFVLLNDWSARDIQAWEYQPLGPFQSKATATTISPWIVTRAALEPFRVDPPAREVALLPYLRDAGPMHYDIELEVEITPAGGASTVVSRTNFRELYYSAAQQLAHHTCAGAPMRAGDLLGSGTVSGDGRENRGSLLELAWGGKEPLDLGGGATRTFLEDGDRVTLRGHARAEGCTIGFGDCTGVLRPAIAPPWPAG
jgi:fumarylacetoacetase